MKDKETMTRNSGKGTRVFSTKIIEENYLSPEKYIPIKKYTKYQRERTRRKKNLSVSYSNKNTKCSEQRNVTERCKTERPNHI